MLTYFIIGWGLAAVFLLCATLWGWGSIIDGDAKGVRHAKWGFVAATAVAIFGPVIILLLAIYFVATTAYNVFTYTRKDMYD